MMISIVYINNNNALNHICMACTVVNSNTVWHGFRGGQWNSGGQCNKETQPIFNAAHLRKYPLKMRALEHVIPKMKTPVIYMNISRMTDFRKDGHPSIYRMEYKTAEEWASAELHQDCSHWCLPGVPDTWNELLYVSLLKYGKGNWKSWEKRKNTSKIVAYTRLVQVSTHVYSLVFPQFGYPSQRVSWVIVCAGD